MSPTQSKYLPSDGISTTKTVGNLLDEYLNVLNAKQRDVDAIRKMHHEIWKESRVYPIIKQHRSGSRVEKQLRISEAGKQSDIDYTFEVTGLEVSSDDNRSTIYWKTSSISNAYGKIFVTKTYKEKLQKMEHHSQIFTEEVFLFDEKEGNFLLIPKMFKENVVRMSGFDYRKDKTTESSKTSPSIPGRGAINEYDVVPCLRLKTWPSISKERLKYDNNNNDNNDDDNNINSENCIFNNKWRRELIENIPLFVVPTGNPMSAERTEEFRLSFSQVEIKCFEQITERTRKYYGLGKYLFKKIFGNEDLLASYHVKTILLWMAEEISADVWNNMDPYEFIKKFFGEIIKVIEKETVRHFFLQNCNIFPKHKVNDEKMANYRIKMATLQDEISNNITELIKYDLKIQETKTTKEIISHGLKVLQTEITNSKAYLNGYLTRLLSVITFSIYENKVQGTLEVAINRIRSVFLSYREEQHISRIIPMVNATLGRMHVNGSTVEPICLYGNKLCSTVDKISEKAHFAFEAFHHKEFETAHMVISEIENCDEYEQNGFGISITSYHKDQLDPQLNFIITELGKESKNGKSPRFYVDPFLLIKHIRIQLDQRNNVNTERLQNHLTDLKDMVEKLSHQEPYLGKLSYRFTGTYLLHGYKQFPLITSDGLEINITLPEQFSLENFRKKLPAGNFDLR